MAKKSALVALLALTPLLAHAHTGVDVVHDFSHGLTHPLFGLDHLLAMIAVGLWAVQLGGRALWAVPTSFVGVMILGSVLGFSGIPLPMVETGILTSVLLLGVLITSRLKFRSGPVPHSSRCSPFSMAMPMALSARPTA